MLDDTVDFYSLSEAEQRRLVRNRRVATTDRLLNEVPENRPAVRIFEKALDHLVLDRLEHGTYKITDLADYFGVRTRDVRQTLHKYRRRGYSGFTKENAKVNLLIDRYGVIRGTSSEGMSLYYTLETIPYFARVLDATLGFSLLDFADRLDDFPRVVESIPSGQATELDEDYAYVVGDHWGIDPEEVFHYLTEFEREYIETALLPLPKVAATDENDRVARRFRQADHVYNMYRVDSEDVDRTANDYLTRFGNEPPGIAAYQAMSIDFADLLWYAQFAGDNSVEKRVDKRLDDIAGTLHPDREPDENYDERTDDPEVDLKDEIRLALSQTPKTVDEIYESIPRDVQVGIDETEITEIVQRMANTGIISIQSEKSPPKYHLEDDKPWKSENS